jgi:hypothetical protein
MFPPPAPIARRRCMQVLFTKTARAALAPGAGVASPQQWVLGVLDPVMLLSNYTLFLRNNATSAGLPGAHAGLVWGPPEHDTCHSPGGLPAQPVFRLSCPALRTLSLPSHTHTCPALLHTCPA